MRAEDGVEKVRSLARSFRFAFRGVRYCIRNERNMRIHLVIAGYVLVFSLFYHLTGLEYAILLIVIGTVLCAEAINTAVEAAVNLHTQAYDTIARIAKDAAAGAVLISAIFAAAVGCIFFLKPDILIMIVEFLFKYPWYGGAFLISLPASLLFIFAYRTPDQIKRAGLRAIRRQKRGKS